MPMIEYMLLIQYSNIGANVWIPIEPVACIQSSACSNIGRRSSNGCCQQIGTIKRSRIYFVKILENNIKNI